VKNYEYQTQGYKLLSPGPETVEEYDSIAKKPGACLEDAVDNEIYRGTIPAFWRRAMPRVAETFGLAIGVDAAATQRAKDRAKTDEARAKVKDVPEKFSSYISRVEAELNDDQKKELEALLKSIALEVSIDPSPTSRASGPGKAYLEKADSWLTLPTDKLEEKVSNALGAIDSFDLERDSEGKPVRESLAGLIKAYVDALTA
jgi:hypothetical protein